MSELFRTNEIPIGPLWKETKYTDSQNVTVFRQDPVDKYGNPDTSRHPRYLGHTLVSLGLPTPIPVTFLIANAMSLEEALKLYPTELDRAAEAAVRHLQEEMVKQKSKIVRAQSVPQQPQADGGKGMSAIARKEERK